MPVLPMGVFPFNLFAPIDNPWQFTLRLVVATILFAAVMFALHQLAPAAKKWLTIVCTFIAGLYFTLEFFWPRVENIVTHEKENFITPTITPVSNFFVAMGAWTIGLGLISLLLVHGKRLVKRMPGWHHSLAFFIAILAMSIAGFTTANGDYKATGFYGLYESLYYGLLQNLDATMFALLAFYIASAAYRAFRIRTVEATVLMIAAFIVMLGVISFGVALTSGIPDKSLWSFFRLEKLSLWVLTWMNSPAYRAVGLGVAIGALAMAMRIWLGLERGVFFSQDK